MTTMATLRTATTKTGRSRPTRIEVALVGGHARIITLAHGDFIAARPLRVAGNHVRIALVGINMALLAGDNLDIRVRAGKGVILEIVEPTGMVAYDAEGHRANWHLDASIDEDATLIWHGAPFVAAQGSNAYRFTELSLASSARALIRETLVLGRSGESGVCLRSRNDVSLNGQPLLVEELNLDKEAGALPGIMAPSRIVSTTMAAGWRPRGDTTDPHRLDLAGPGAIFRSLKLAMHRADDHVAPLFQDWRQQTLS